MADESRVPAAEEGGVDIATGVPSRVIVAPLDASPKNSEDPAPLFKIQTQINNDTS
jgi:hypothetical protein